MKGGAWIVRKVSKDRMYVLMNMAVLLKGHIFMRIGGA